MIGDLNTAALVGPDGLIDFLSFPRFDSPTVFAALLDSEKGGKFQIAPKAPARRQKKMYFPNTNVLFSRFLFDDGVAEISDFMPAGDKKCAHMIVRRVKTIRGTVKYKMICDPRFNYGRSLHRIERLPDGAVFVGEDDLKTVLRLRSQIPIKIHEGAAFAEFELKAGESASFTLEPRRQDGDSPADGEHFVAEAFKQTVNFWRSWLSRSNYRGRWREMVGRSALVLKLLTSQEHGSIIAAPTFGLPEEIGGERNWDYRFTWIRDASFTLYALMRLGFTEEADAFMFWLEHRIEGLSDGGALEIMYRIDGSKLTGEEQLDHLEGYLGSRPVRIGNGAHNQLQLDIYGELLDSIYLFNKFGRPISHDLWMDVSRLVNWVCENWRLQDEGIWEVRGGRKSFLLSRVMCWVAVDRALR
ncbi:MAG: glucoamylase, partial [Proteobacteria bacterium]